MADFIILEGINNEIIVVNRAEISSIVSEDEERVSIIYMANGNEFTIRGSAKDILFNKVGTKQI